MTFQPIIPATGIVGWNFLQSTYDKQFETFTKDPVLQRESEYFLEKIGDVKTAEDLLNDYRLLETALGAFGLQEDVSKRALIERVLTEGTTADDALANKLGDDRYKKLSEAFGFGPGQSVMTGDIKAMTDLVYTNQVQEFEAAVGEQDHAMRVAMFGEREVAVLATDGTSVNTKWFNVMGQPALREMFEVALNLPSSLAQIDLDQQLETFKDRAQAVFGSDDIAIFEDPEKMDKLLNTYLAKAQIAEFEASQSSASTALMLLMS
ncbi:DUF1217 domain-containing protein [Roseobacteraceae bacterium NS-SX3]